VIGDSEGLPDRAELDALELADVPPVGATAPVAASAAPAPAATGSASLA
jgi:hypothetical protein